MSAPLYTEVTHEGRYGESPLGEWYQDAKGRTQFKATRLLKCAWTDCPALIGWLMSEAGASYPHPDGTTYAYVRNIKPRGRGQTSSGGTNMIAYAEAVLEVYYCTEGPRWINNTSVSEEMKAHQFWIAPPGGRLKWSNDDWVTPEEKAAAIPFLGWTYQLTLSNLLALPTTPLSYIGTCNASTKTCYYLGLSFASQTVLYGPPAISSYSAMGQGTRYTAVYNHGIRPHGFNRFWHAKTGAWEYLYQPNDDIYVQTPLGW